MNSIQKPWVPVQAQMHDHAMTLAGVPVGQYYRDAGVFVETYRDVAAYYGMDSVLPSGDVYNYEIEAMGGRMVYSENAMPTIDFRDPLIKTPEDLKKIKTPDFYRDGRLPYALDCIKLRQTGSGSFCSIFSLAVGLRTYPVLIKDMRKRPELVRQLFDLIIDRVLVPYLKVQKEYCGITSATGSDAWVSVPSLSVREMNEWVRPYNLRLMEEAQKFGVKVIPGGGDYCEEDPAKFDAEVAKGTFDFEMLFRGGNTLNLGMGIWHRLPLEVVRDYTAPYRERGIKITINAGVNARVVRDGPVDMIVGIVKRYIKAFARDHDLAIWLANIPADTPPGHVHAAIAAAHVYGALPLAADLDKVAFALPERETFPEWRRHHAGRQA